MNNATKRIVIIEPDLVWAKTFSERVLANYNYAPFLASGPNDGLLLALNNKPHLLILHLSPEDSLQFLRRLERAHQHLPSILIVDHPVEEISIELVRLGVRDCIAHPFLFDDVAQSITRILNTETGASGDEKRDASGQFDERFEIMERRVKEFEMIFKIGRSINAQFDLESMLNRVTEAAVYITGAEEGYLLLVDEKTGNLELRTAQNLGERAAKEFSLPISDSVAGAVVRTGKPVIFGGETQQNYKVKTGYLVKSLINVPLRVNEQVIGVLGVDNQISQSQFSSTHLNRLSMLADTAAAMLEHARQYTNLHKRLKRLTLEVDTIQALSEQIKTAIDFEAGVQSVLSALLRITRAEAGVLMWQPKAADRPQYFSLGSLGDQVLNQTKSFSDHWWDVGMLADIFRTGQPLLQNLPAERGTGRLSRVARCRLAVPLHSTDQRVVGVLSLESTVEQALSAADLDFVVSFSDPIVLMLERLLLQRATRITNTRFAALTNFIDEALCVLDADLRLLSYNQAAGDTLDLAIKDAVGRSFCEWWPPTDGVPHPFCLLIEQAIAEKRVISFGNDLFVSPQPGAGKVAGGRIVPVFEGNRSAGAMCLFRSVQPDRSDFHLEFEFANMASHLFRTPLNFIQNSIDLLLHTDVPPQEQAAIFKKMQQQSQQLTNLTHELLKILRIEVEGIAVQQKSLQIRPLVENALALLKNQDPRYAFKVSIADPMPPVYGDLSKTELVLINLLLNAVKRSAGGGDITIKAWVNQTEAIISVVDNGEPVTPKMRRRIFERFYAVDDEGGKMPSTYQLGLFTTRRLVELQNGRIWIENLADGVSFNFSLPLEERVNDHDFDN